MAFLVGDILTADQANLMLYPPIAILVANSAQSIPNITDTAILFPVETVDSVNGHSTSVNTSRYTCQTGYAGWYQLSGGATFASNATGVRIGTWRINGIPAGNTGGSTIVANSYTGTRIPMVTQTVFLNVGDYAEMVLHQNSGGALNTEAGGGGVTDIHMNVLFLRPA